MELKRLHEATLRKEYLSESDLSKYMYSHAQDFIELIEAAENVSVVCCIGNIDALRVALKPFEGDK